MFFPPPLLVLLLLCRSGAAWQPQQRHNSPASSCRRNNHLDGPSWSRAPFVHQPLADRGRWGTISPSLVQRYQSTSSNTVKTDTPSSAASPKTFTQQQVVSLDDNDDDSAGWIHKGLVDLLALGRSSEQSAVVGPDNVLIYDTTLRGTSVAPRELNSSSYCTCY